jgi:spermidine synthase
MATVWAMKSSLEELDCCQTKLGELTLRRRHSPSMEGAEIYEVSINGQFLMSSLVNDSEIALTEIGLRALGPGPLDVVVGGLGLGYTAKAAIDDPRVQSVVVIEYLPEVIAWHTGSLVPLGRALTESPRCKFIEGDFFGLMRASTPHLDSQEPDKKYHAILVDIDHSPEALLHPDNGGFYSPEGLRRLTRHMHPSGVFALWSADPADEAFMATLGEAFARTETHEVKYYNALLDLEDVNTIYVAHID